jgi:hypothetical protein
MNLTTEEKFDLAHRLCQIDVEMESLPQQDIPQTHQIYRALALSRERTSLRQQLVADLL